MSTYKAERQHHGIYIFKQWIIVAVLLTLPVAVEFFYPTKWITEFYIWAAITFLVIYLWVLATKARTSKIVIDTDRQTISQYYSGLIGGSGERIVLMDKLRLYVKGDNTGLVFYKNNREVLALYKSKDGFSIDTLKLVKMDMEKQGVRVTE